jgi:hypothetical protein
MLTTAGELILPEFAGIPVPLKKCISLSITFRLDALRPLAFNSGILDRRTAFLPLILGVEVCRSLIVSLRRVLRSVSAVCAFSSPPKWRITFSTCRCANSKALLAS